MKRLTAAFLSLIMLFSLTSACATAQKLPGELYDDVPDDHWGIVEITHAYETGMMQGVADRQFGLGQSLDRASFFTMLCRMFGWELVAPESPTFIDCDPAAWYYSAVETAYQNDAISYSVSVRPEDYISRMEMAEALVRALDYDQLAATVASYGNPFSDVGSNGYATIAYDIGMVRGVSSGGRLQMNPNSSATREEAAAMLMRVYDRYVAPMDWLHGFYALSSSNQISLTADMDAVSFGWSRLAADEEGNPYLLQERKDGNEWIVPAGADWAKSTLDGYQTTYNLNVFASVWSGSVMTDMLQSTAKMQQAVVAIATASEGYAGITIDFEGVNEAQRDSFSLFMQLLREKLPEGKTLYVCVMPTNYFAGYDFRALGQSCDKVIMMAHDYVPTSIPASYIGTPRTEYPEAPIGQIYYALQALTHPETGVEDLSKCALAISFAATAFPVDEEGKLTGTELLNPDMDIMAKRLTENTASIGWSDTYRSPHITYQTEEGDWYKVWYEDARSVEEKIILARMFGVNGISLWRVGQIPNDKTEGIYYDAWQTILNQQ